MGVLDLFRRTNVTEQRLSTELAATRDMLDVTQESLADAELALEDRGWRRLTDGAVQQFTRDGLGRAAEVGQAMAVTNTLIKRGLELRIAYIWGSGVQVSAVAAVGDGQDVNQVVQGFIDDVGNQRAVFGEQAREENERALGTDGNVFVACFTRPLTGSVQARTIAFAEIVDVICNPDDRDDPWFYRRRWTATEIDQTSSALRTVEHDEFYPALGYRPRVKPKFLDGKPVNWDTPILHISANRLDGWKFGVGDVLTAVPWAEAYRSFLADWAQLVKALSQFAWQLTAKGSKASKAAAVLKARSEQLQAAVQTGTGSTAGATIPDAYSLEAVPKSGATIDSQSGKPLAAMVAAGLGLPVTMLLGDPGVTGARATAETLDQPMRLTMQARRSRWTEALQALCAHVIRESVRAPQGALKGTISRDEHGREVVTLAGDVDQTVQVAWPDLDDTDIPAMVTAVVEAYGTGTLPPLTTARLLMQLLDVPDIDDLLDEMTDADGNWVDPVDAAAARSQQAAVAAGDEPAA